MEKLRAYCRHLRISLVTIFILILAASCLLTFTAYRPWTYAITGTTWFFNFTSGADDNNISSRAACPEGLQGMLQGRWEPGKMTADDVKRINTFLKHVREVQFNMPTGLQREDKLCGNLTFERRTNLPEDWFRALCDSEGPTPCCHSTTHTCVAKTVEECQCPGCLDMRTQLHAEYATWRTANPACQPRDFTAQELCRLLDGGTFIFMGDSLVRHVHTAMLLTIRDNDETGAFSDSMPKEIQDQCRNLYMFTEKVCRLHVAGEVRWCDGKVLFRHLGTAYNSNGPTIRNEIIKLKNMSRSVVFVGLGFHGGLNSKNTFSQVMQPVLEQMRTENWQWPKILWASVHSFNVLKNPNLKGQQPPDVLRFNREMAELFAPYMAPGGARPLYVFNAFNMTAPAASFDGSHYGMGVNKVKVKILMNFIHRLSEDGLW